MHWWIEHHWHDFALSLDFRAKLKGFLTTLIADPKSPFLYLGKRLLDMAAKQNLGFTQMLETYHLLENTNAKKPDQVDFFSKFDAASIAQQLTLHNYTIFKNIHPIEFLHEIWKKNNDASPSFKHFVNRFDMESYWVITELCLNAKNFKDRVKILSKFISVANVSCN